METSSKLRLRGLWFQVHKWVGLTLAALIIPISLTGAALVWHHPLDEMLNPQRHGSAQPVLQPADYAAASLTLSAEGEKLLSLTYPEHGGAVLATLARPPVPGAARPVRTLLYLDPTTASLIERTSNDEGLMRVLHVLHGSLMIPGVGRTIVGWIGVAMLLSSLTGLWLWWPLKGGFRRGLRWSRQPSTSGNLHYQGGFWIALPLAVLSLTGAWISFPAFFAQLSGDPAGPSPAERMRRMSAVPLVETQLDPTTVRSLSANHASGPLVTISWPTEKASAWKVSYGHEGALDEVQVDDRTGAITPPKPRKPETTARLMRRIHDGTGMGRLWQTIIFIGGIVPALLGVTGILMWLSVRRRRRLMERKRANRPEMVTA